MIQLIFFSAGQILETAINFFISIKFVFVGVIYARILRSFELGIHLACVINQFCGKISNGTEYAISHRSTY